MRFFIFLFLSLVTIFCYQNCAGPVDTHPTTTPPNFVTDSTFTPYIQEFEGYYGKTVENVPVAFEDLKKLYPDKYYAGVCYRLIVGDRSLYAYVKIDKNYWGYMSELQRRNLIIHELGHCALNRDHVKSDSVRQCPTSFMHDTIMDNWCLQEHFDEYVKEMFP